MIEPEGTAPYAPSPAVTAVIDAYRNKPVPTPITIDVVKRIGIAAGIAHRTVQSLKLLDLLDSDGNPTPAFQDLRKAGEDAWRDRLADVVRAAYAELFTYRDPISDDPAKIADAFRAYKPHSMRLQMARLFYGLCEEAGIIAAKPAVTAKPSTVKSKVRKAPLKPAVIQPKAATHTATTKASGEIERTAAASPTISAFVQSGADHMAIRGLLQTLPPVGAVFPDNKRREWADAVLAAFALIYERESSSNKEASSD